MITLSRKRSPGLETPAAVNRDLVEYAEAPSRTTQRPVPGQVKLLLPKIGRVMATNRAFAKAVTALLSPT